MVGRDGAGGDPEADHRRTPHQDGDHDEPPEALRAYCNEKCGVILGHGIGELSGKAFRVAHMGHVNAPMILGTLSVIEVALNALDIPQGIHGMTPKSVKKKLKQPSFAAAVDRDELRHAAEDLGVDFDVHVAFVIAAMEEHADVLGLRGTEAA